MSESSKFLTTNNAAAEWWRTSVIYQIYPRSFADSDGDGLGDLKGITSRLDSLSSLGIDAIWFSPFFKSPQKDAGYDISDYTLIDPIFGTNEDFEVLLAKAKSLGIRIIVDIVPNHTSDQHAWFQAALKAAPGSEERAYYHFKEGKGVNGELPPNNWQSIFGGPAWSRIIEADGSLGQWYLHLFDSSQRLPMSSTRYCVFG
jgi:alpha-glucosidase